ncbi:uncharacterized protein LOC119668966 isoform X2 [Teleopsis dalmanni]|uniref:uncharacterized protein LOC119668966 isoform X2 n=1 Tax=Teleopsis dalmanni TaxID=139649 RepID=UPI0018CF6876|nr:uncharacterized protein LOC119668966 isoform X2 [Teleopsis dalmanni]
MYPRLPGPIGADIFLGATTTVRSVFPNSRLDSLANFHHTSPTEAPIYGNQLLSPFDRTSLQDYAATATINDDAFGAGAGVGAGAGASGGDGGATVSSSSNPLNNYLPENDDDWWSNAIEEDTFESPLAFDASENGLWNGRFVPPPPRPPFLDESVAADGLTTCDLCTWAWQRNAYSLDGSMDPAGELGWAFTLIIVSIISALIGAIIMVIVLRCRRIKSANGNGGRPQPWWCRNNRNGSQNGRSTLSVKHPSDSIRRPTSNSGVWTWLGGSRRSSVGPDQIGPPSSSPAENHYTHMDDAYSPVGVSEALYAELDRESVRSANPSYQNTAYSQCEDYHYQQHEQDIPMVVSSAPSSAYYSDLSVTAMPGGGGNERAYEIVGLTVMSQPLPNWDSGGRDTGSSETALATQRRMPRLAAINETSTTTVPSDYV